MKGGEHDEKCGKKEGPFSSGQGIEEAQASQPSDE